ncbi:hypothetical protein Hanom_Chr08g00724521 [Helianthus anomalus]
MSVVPVVGWWLEVVPVLWGEGRGCFLGVVATGFVKNSDVHVSFAGFWLNDVHVHFAGEERTGRRERTGEEKGGRRQTVGCRKGSYFLLMFFGSDLGFFDLGFFIDVHE